MSIQRNDWSLQRKGIIDQDRHKERVREAIKKNLGSIVSNEAIILSDGKRKVKVPIRALDEYKFRFDYRKRKHVGQGDGKTRVGDVIGREGQPGQGQGQGQGGGQGGGEYYEAEVNIDEIAALIFEDLQLPFLEEKAKKAVQAKTTRFNEIRRTGVMANLDKRRMILENIKRNAREGGEARFGDVKKEDLRFKTWEETLRYESNAVVISMMDVSGCLTAGHLIEMADGSYKDISEIQKDDEVACVDLHNYRKTTSKAIATFTKQARRTLVIEAQDSTLRATPEHVFFVYDEIANRIVEKKAAQLAEGDKLILINSWGRFTQQQENWNQTLTTEQAYLIGVLLGDGHLRRPSKPGSYGTYLSISDENLERLKHYQQLFEVAFGKRGIIKLKRSKDTRQRLNVNSTALVHELAARFPMLAHRSPQRYIESSIYREPPQVRAAFLRGLFDAEGTLAHHSVILNSSSSTLVKQAKQLLSYWGIRARVTHFVQSAHRLGDKPIKSGLYYTLSINAKDAIRFRDVIGFACSEKAKKLETLVGRQESGINAMRSKFIMPFDWRERFEHLPQMRRTYSYYQPQAHALSYSQLQTIAGDSQIQANDLQAIKEVLDNQFIVSKVKRVSAVDEPVTVYDFEVAEHHNYIVDGMLSHNSMGEFKKYIARSFFFWMVRFLRTKYDNVEIAFISHHTEAKEVTEEQFFTQGESGGTVVSSAYQLALDIINLRYRPTDWNIYPFHFSDGDNYYSDNEEAVRLADQLISTCNLFGYGEIGEEGASSYRRSSGALLSIFNDRLKQKDRFVGVRIDEKEDVYPALKHFFGRRNEL
jgi:uncharacterized sporulation protein YeaH/YhbH (DUF444 family)/DNA-binding transcriptional regulator WhiA